MKEFACAAKAADDPDIEIPTMFKVGDLTCRAYQPTSGQVAMMFSRASERNEDGERTAATIDFMLGIFDKETSKELGSRLLDRDDPFELENLTEIFEWLMEEWGARPTQSPSASSRSRASGGRKSTGKPRAVESTHLVSASTASST